MSKKLDVIEGNIVDVMESWPLQLIVETDSNRYYVMLLMDTMIMLKGRKASPGELRRNVRVLVKGQIQSEKQLSMTAQEIEIL